MKPKNELESWLALMQDESPLISSNQCSIYQKNDFIMINTRKNFLFGRMTRLLIDLFFLLGGVITIYLMLNGIEFLVSDSDINFYVRFNLMPLFGAFLLFLLVHYLSALYTKKIFIINLNESRPVILEYTISPFTRKVTRKNLLIKSHSLTINKREDSKLDITFQVVDDKNLKHIPFKLDSLPNKHYSKVENLKKKISNTWKK